MRPQQYSQRFGSGQLAFNMTPMIDVTFQLIIFFILASQMASETLAKLDLHKPYQSVAQAQPPRQDRTRTVINIMLSEDDASRCVYKVDGRLYSIHEQQELLDLLGARKAAVPEAVVEVRADRRVLFGAVAPVLDLATKAGYTQMHITALLEGGPA